MTSPVRFTFESAIHAQGGFGKIKKGRDNVLERDVAVKTLSGAGTTLKDESLERFKREAKILASMTHPNIPSIYDINFDAKEFAIYFQFIHGDTLSQVITSEGAVPLSTVRAWFTQLASALTHAHEKGIIHRDVKPDNIIVAHNREVAYLVDFGIALSREDSLRLTESGYTIGTLGYMSPEQTAGVDIDARTDVYSLAITLYEVLAGRRFPVGEYEELSIHNEAIPPQIDSLIQDCLLPKDKRVPTPESFASRLAAALVTTRPLSEILAHGRLHELAAALEEYTPSEFMQLPAGQRLLVLAKLEDVVTSDDPKLTFAAEELLQIMLTVGLLLSSSEFGEIAKPAILWGFDRQVGSFDGSNHVRKALEAAAVGSRGDVHECLSELFADYFENIELPAKGEWYLHPLRQILQALLANASCGEKAAGRLVRLLRAVNAAQKEKQRK